MKIEIKGKFIQYVSTESHDSQNVFVILKNHFIEVVYMPTGYNVNYRRLDIKHKKKQGQTLGYKPS